MLRGPGKFKDTGHFLTTEVTQKPACSVESQAKSFPLTKTMLLDFKFDYNVDLAPKTPIKEHSFSSDIVDFEHTYEITNEGLSPTNEDKAFYVYIPHVLLADPPFTDEHQARCEFLENIPKSFGSKDLSQISCNTVGCRKYNCTLKQGFAKIDPVGVILRMKFSPKLNSSGLITEKFDIITQVDMGSEVSRVQSKSTFKKNAVGSLAAIKRWWPVILGVGIATILFGACIYGLVKTGIFQKLRIYNKPDDYAS